MYQQLLSALEQSARPVGPTPAAVPGHDVQFYRTDAYLTRSVVEFLAQGVRAGQPLIVIATPAHRRAFQDGLRLAGLDTEAILSGREAVWLDARQSLEACMIGTLPNRELFMATVGNVFESILKKRYYLIVRGYGEMVDLLWKDRNADGAIMLEGFWNELAEKYAYSLLCGYAIDNFLHEAGVEGFRRVCDHHTHALPIEPHSDSAA